MAKILKIACISDMHGQIDFKVDPCDILLIAGDICSGPYDKNMASWQQEDWLESEFFYWVAEQPATAVVAIAGNHDWIWEVAPTLVPDMPPKFHYIQDEMIEVMGVKIYGTPQQPIFLDWAFNKPSDRLRMYYDNIPEGLDILLSHAPVQGIFDRVEYKGDVTLIGSQELKDRVEIIRPRFFVSGHAHSNYGILEQDGITYIACSVLDDKYVRTKPPIYFEMEI